ncbi:MAG: isoprenoid biosynthesis glyoxalase ElbB [Bacteroidales bacterium]|nr:isoprenoid biosynthesis glyoxalase ElbB [Bacteroidales bacterium]
MRKVAVILSGCGNRDGSELQETLSLMLAVDRKGWQYQCFAPEGLFEVVSHVDDKLDEEDAEEGTLEDVPQRDIFEESARVARGNILPLDHYKASDYDALLLPGGMGAARNLSTYAFDGPRMTVVDGVLDAILETYRAKKPVCAECIAPIVVAKVLGRYGVHLTLGSQCQASEVAEGFGARHEVCGPGEVCVDAEHKVITTPAYMVATRISQVFDGSSRLIDELEVMLDASR